LDWITWEVLSCLQKILKVRFHIEGNVLFYQTLVINIQISR
jgi:hypothetical protein